MWWVNVLFLLQPTSISSPLTRSRRTRFSSGVFKCASSEPRWLLIFTLLHTLTQFVMPLVLGDAMRCILYSRTVYTHTSRPSPAPSKNEGAGVGTRLSYTHTYIHMHTCTHTYIHTYIHTHIRNKGVYNGHSLSTEHSVQKQSRIGEQ